MNKANIFIFVIFSCKLEILSKSYILFENMQLLCMIFFFSFAEGTVSYNDAFLAQFERYFDSAKIIWSLFEYLF